MTNVENAPKEASFQDVIRVDEDRVRSHVDEVVRATVEDTLNSLLNAEADELCGAKRYERSMERLDTRAGHYKRKLLTKTGEVELKVPRLRSLPFESQIIERYRRRESSVEEALVEMYVTVRWNPSLSSQSSGRAAGRGVDRETDFRPVERAAAW